MTSINEILAPKSYEEVGEQINKMEILHFLELFKNQEWKAIRKMDIGFKKKFHFFFTFIMPKIFNRCYWYLWGTWLAITIFSNILIPQGDLWPYSTIDLLDDIGLFIIYLFWIPIFISLIFLRKLNKWNRQRGWGLLLQFQHHLLEDLEVMRRETDEN